MARRRSGLGLEKCSKQETMLLISILALMTELPEDISLYTEAIGELRRKFFNKPGRHLKSRTRGFIDGHQIRATERWNGANHAAS